MTDTIVGYKSHQIAMNRCRNPKVMVVVDCQDGGEWKTRGTRLIEALNAYYSRRLGYVLSPRKFEKFKRLYLEGWDGAFMTPTLVPPKVA